MMLWMFSCWPGLGRDSGRGETSLQINESSAAAAAAEPESGVRSQELMHYNPATGTQCTVQYCIVQYSAQYSIVQ